MNVEDQLRDMLHAKADEFDLQPMPTSLARHVRRRRVPFAPAAAAAAVAAVAALASAVAPDGGGPERFTAVNVAAASDTADPGDIDGDPGQGVSEQQLRRNVECMRTHGFDLPDPTVTEDGWSVILDDPLPDTDQWRQAVFVD